MKNILKAMLVTFVLIAAAVGFNALLSIIPAWLKAIIGIMLVAYVGISVYKMIDKEEKK